MGARMSKVESETGGILPIRERASTAPVFYSSCNFLFFLIAGLGARSAAACKQ
jgi:hypothetical protein